MIVKNINSIKHFNLHLHTNVSDGRLTPEEVVNRANEIGLDLISITDHDNADAYNLLPKEIAPLRIIPGIEISSLYQGSDVHILGLGLNLHSQSLLDMIEMYLVWRKERAIKMIHKLAELGMPISLDEVVAISGSRGLIVRPHIAQVLLNHGYVHSKSEAFEKYIGDNGPAYVHKPEFSTQEAIEVIHKADGFAIIAHPGDLAHPAYVNDIIKMGIDGLEVWHPDHNLGQIAHFTDLCKNLGLYMTGGSDFHGDNERYNLFEEVPASEIILESVNKLWREYKCRIN